MVYSAADESFTHQLPTTFDQVHDPDPTWSDRCYFFAASAGRHDAAGQRLWQQPEHRTGLGYVKVSLADGRHWDLLSGRPVAGADRADLSAGPMRWTCVEPLKKWRLDVEPNDSGIEWELYYEPTAPMWELLPMKVRGKDGQMLADMYHMKEPGRWSGWVQIDGQRISVDGFHGGRDRTFGVRVSDKIDFWLWLDAGFEDRAIEAWIIESYDGTVNYVDGGITHNDGTLSKRFVKIEHDVEFDGDRKRPVRAVLVFTDEDGATYRVTADTPHQDVNAYYGLPMAHCQYEDLGGGAYFIHFQWDSNDSETTRRDRGQIDGARPADALPARLGLGPTPDGASSSCCSAVRAIPATPTGRRWTCRRSLRTRPRSERLPADDEEFVNDPERQHHERLTGGCVPNCPTRRRSGSRGWTG